MRRPKGAPAVLPGRDGRLEPITGDCPGEEPGQTADCKGWKRFVDSAVQGNDPGAPDAGHGVAGSRPTTPESQAGGLRKYLGMRWGSRRAEVRPSAGKAVADSDGTAPKQRTDLRLALPAVSVWAASLAGLWLRPVELAGLCSALIILAGLLLRPAGKRGTNAAPPSRVSPTSRGSTHREGKTWRKPADRGLQTRQKTADRGLPTRRDPAGRSLQATVAVACLLAAAAAGHSAAGSVQRHVGPLAEAVASGQSVVAVVEVAGTPRALAPQGQAGQAPRWSVPVRIKDLSTQGAVLRTTAELIVIGGGRWGTVLPGQRVRVAGKLRPADPGRKEAGLLAASTEPATNIGPTVLHSGASSLREQFVSASAFLPHDARGLLPGMVTGDTGALDAGLAAAMKRVGMTHLTAVSGANCALVIGGLLLVCRRLRVPRAPAAVLALAGLGAFVLLVGPDPSVLRAGLMGAVGVAALAAGRPGRGLSLLSLTVITLLLIDPALGGTVGFLLSVTATLGIIALGRRIISWAPIWVPRWAAAGVAVPLSAQLLCGPVIVVLQPQFSTYSLLANILAAPLVVPVTLLGTAAVPLLVVLPWAAGVLIALAGIFSAGVAAIARFSAGLPGAALPWPEGFIGVLTMLVLSVLTFSATWAMVRPQKLFAVALAAHGRTVLLLEVLEVRGPGTFWERRRPPLAPRRNRYPAWRRRQDVAGWDTPQNFPEGNPDARCAETCNPFAGIESCHLAGCRTGRRCPGDRAGGVHRHQGHGQDTGPGPRFRT